MADTPLTFNFNRQCRSCLQSWGLQEKTTCITDQHLSQTVLTWWRLWDFQWLNQTWNSPLHHDVSRCCRGNIGAPPKSASCSGCRNRKEKSSFSLAVVHFGFDVNTVPTICVLPGHSFAVHKPSVGSLDDFKAQISPVHTKKRNKVKASEKRSPPSRFSF